MELGILKQKLEGPWYRQTSLWSLRLKEMAEIQARIKHDFAHFKVPIKSKLTVTHVWILKTRFLKLSRMESQVSMIKD